MAIYIVRIRPFCLTLSLPLNIRYSRQQTSAKHNVKWPQITEKAREQPHCAFDKLSLGPHWSIGYFRFALCTGTFTVYSRKTYFWLALWFMALRLAAEEGLSRSGKACKGRGVEEVGHLCGYTNCVQGRQRNRHFVLFVSHAWFMWLFLSLSTPLFFFPPLPFSFTLSCSFSRCCCCRSLFDSQLEVEVTSNLCAVICPLSFPYPTPPSPIVGYICKLPAINFCPFAIKHLKRFVRSKRKKLRKKATNRGAKTKRANHFHSIFPHDAVLVLYNQRFSHHFHTQLTERENREGKREGRIGSESWENA